MCLVVLMVCLCSKSFSQSYFFYVHEAPAARGETRIYKTLVSLQPDGTATARMQYNSGPAHKLYLYELKLTDTTLTSGDSLHKFLICTTAPTPLLDADSNAFAWPRFVFAKNRDSSGYYYAPIGIEIQDSLGKTSPSKMITAVQKSFDELRADEPFVSSFYFESDAFYQYVFDDRSRDIPMVRNERMFLVLVANTNDPTVGKSAATDLKNTNNFFNAVAQNLGINKIFPLIVSGDGYSKLAVEASLAALEAQHPSQEDIIIFYFSGHGFRLAADKSAYPRMSFRTAKNKANQEVGENIPLEDVYNRINALNARVCLVLGDCCNADIYANPVFGTDVLTPKGGGTLGYFNSETAKKLFLPASPVSMIVGSVKKDHLSVGHPDIGGYYTHFFVSELQKNLWGYYSNNLLSFGGQSQASWMKILLEARKNTYWKSKAKQCGRTANDRCIQEAEINVRGR